MSRAVVVDLEYRLRSTDLHRDLQRVVISNVSFQGLEELNPVLHFEGLLRRLVLSRTHVRSLIQITGSVIFTDWIGCTVVLAPQGGMDEDEIQIQPIDEQDRSWLLTVLPRSQIDLNGWVLSILIVLVMTMSSLAYVWRNYHELWETLMALLG